MGPGLESLSGASEDSCEASTIPLGLLNAAVLFALLRRTNASSSVDEGGGGTLNKVAIAGREEEEVPLIVAARSRGATTGGVASGIPLTVPGR